MDEEGDEGLFELLSLVDTFNKMLKSQTLKYFDVDEFESLADYFFDLGKVKKALMVLEMATEQHPGAANFLARKVQYLTASNKTQEAKEELINLEQLAPDSFELHMGHGGLQSRQHNHQKAIFHFKKALKVTDFPEDVWPVIAMEYHFMGEHGKAIIYLKKTLDANPDDEIILYHIATSFEMVEGYTEGIRFFEAFVEDNPFSEIAWYQLGQLNEKIDETEKALKAYDFAILIDDYFMAPYFEKANILEYHFRFPEAVEVYERALEVDEGNGYIYYRIGLCHMKLFQRLKAESNFMKALQYDEEFEDAYMELALLKDEDEHWSEAIYFAKKAVELDNLNNSFLQLSASIHRRAGMLDEAELLYEKMADNDYSGPDLYIDWAELLFDMCEFDNGMEVLYKGVNLNPDSADIHFRISGYLYTLTENDEADIYLKKAMLLDADRRFMFFDLFPKLKNSQAVKAIINPK
jgi:tetratricopeptide (TPR) repeat protein